MSRSPNLPSASPARPSLYVHAWTENTPDAKALFTVPFGQCNIGKGVVLPAPLNQLPGGILPGECWYADGGLAATWLVSGDCPALPQSRWQAVMAGDMAVIGVDWDERQHKRPLSGEERVAVTREAYRHAIRQATAQGFDTLLRTWNYLPAINHQHGTLDGYQLFCRGREQARTELQAKGLFMQDHHPAATAIGTRDSRWQFVFLCGRKSHFEALENPRQIPAWEYPAHYSPSKPVFARAVRLGDTVLCSGTASVLGHATSHPDQVVLQCEESLRNVQALLGTIDGRPYALEQGIYRVYVRHAADAPAVARIMSQHGIANFVLLHGDICRADLLVECEAVFCRQNALGQNR